MPVMSFSQASLHSRITSVAYLWSYVNKAAQEGNCIWEYDELLVLAFAGECKLVFRLPIRNLIDTKPFVCGPQETG